MIKTHIKRLLKLEFIRFLFVGAVNTLFGYGVYYLARLISHSDAISLIFANVLGVLFNFNTLGKIVFKNHELKLIFRFFLVYAIIYVVNLSALKIMNYFGLESIIGQAFLVIPIALLSYILNKILVFRNSKAEKALSDNNSRNNQQQPPDNNQSLDNSNE